ncbi:MAG: RnfABCDGE type electron transport complex subunit D [Flavobacteriales bacterium]
MQIISSTISWLRSDGRHFQIIAQVSFLLYGILSLGWDADWRNYTAIFSAVVFAQLLAIRFAGYPFHSLKSALITGLGLSLLMKANDPWLYLFAALLAIGMKFLTKVNGKHLWNPANFGIVAIAALSGDAWISPGQWGSSALIMFIVGTAGLAVLSNIKRLETGIAFLVTYALLDYSRTVLYLGWEHDVFLLKMGSGSLWLFSFFMITDPMTTPNHRKTRIVWSIAVAAVSFYLTNFKFLNGAPFWTLFFFTPISPLLDYLTPRIQSFDWKKRGTTSETIQQKSL